MTYSVSATMKGRNDMQYKFATKDNFEDFASGRVIYHKNGVPTYPVRLSSEIFSRCIEHINKNKDFVIYDPCCGGAYTLTVLGLLFPNLISKIYGSDINPEAVELAKDNLSLLSHDGLSTRKSEIENMINKFAKLSHREALESAEHFFKIINTRNISVSTECFIADILETKSLNNLNFTADIIFADVPYGNLVDWSNPNENQMDLLLETISPVINNNSIIAISSDKKQKINLDKYIRLEKIKVGKRKIELLKLKEVD